MTEDQKAILKSFAKADRGLVDSDKDDYDSENEPNLIEMDPIEAAAKRAKIRQKAMKEKRLAREAALGDEDALEKRKVRFAANEDDSGEEIEMESDSDELAYDSEEERFHEEEFQKKMKRKAIEEAEAKQVINTKEMPAFADIQSELKKSVKFRAAEGVKFTQYDEMGLPTETKDGIKISDWVTKDTSEFETVLAAPAD